MRIHLKYKHKVLVIAGFYKGCSGEVISPLDRDNNHKVRLNDMHVAEIPAEYLKLEVTELYVLEGIKKYKRKKNNPKRNL